MNHLTRNSLLVSVAIGMALGLAVFMSSNSTLTPESTDGVHRASATDIDRLRHEEQSREEIDETSSRGLYSSPRGREFEIEVRTDTESALISSSRDQQERVRYSLRGHWRALVLDRRHTELILRFSMHAVRLQIGSVGGDVSAETKAGLAEELAQPVDVRISDQGEVLGVRFRDDVPPETKDWVNSLLALLIQRVPIQAGNEWFTQERDTTGLARYHYRWLTDRAEDGTRRLRREKTRYEADETLGDQGASIVPVVRASGQTTVDYRVGMVRRLQFDETMTVAWEGDQFRVEHRSKSFMILRSSREVLPSSIPEIDWDSQWSPFGSAGGDERDESAAHYSMVLNGVEVSELVAQFSKLISENRFDSSEFFQARQKLVWMIRLRPQDLDELEAWVRSGRLGPDAAGAILSAAGQAGHERAQSFLVEFLQDERAAEHHRLGAAMSMFQLSSPSDSSIRAVRRIVASGSAPEALRSTGLLLLGDFADPGKTISEQGLLEKVIRLEPGHEQEGQVETWLRAIANARPRQSLEAVTKYLDHPSDSLRAAAVSTLASVVQPPATQRLQRMALGDPSERVRAEVAEALAWHGDAVARDTLRSMVRKDASPHVRTAALAGLARIDGKGDRNVALLRWVVSNDPSEQVRQQARGLLDRFGAH